MLRSFDSLHLHGSCRQDAHSRRHQHRLDSERGRDRPPVPFAQFSVCPTRYQRLELELVHGGMTRMNLMLTTSSSLLVFLRAQGETSARKSFCIISLYSSSSSLFFSFSLDCFLPGGRAFLAEGSEELCWPWVVESSSSCSLLTGRLTSLYLAGPLLP
ncbi:hypothetical protein SORBI_3008G104100 [Sorghum bicolor]|uniref:Uncharacterized protein n=1 Tax=Sorghum bicolor TaxID=4558 RepID=A0A1B6PD91_SORBI|nr:hypothetical protein SORBI_3008G104100 [Sorghum bicolor]